MKIKNLLFIASILIISACKKNENNNTPTSHDKYLTTSAGSTWSYHETDSSGASPVNSDYTITSSSSDTSINSKSYHIYNNSAGGNQYLNITGNDYYQFDSLPAGFGAGVFERLYLKDSAYAGTNWSETQTVSVTGVPFPVPVTINYSIAEINISRTVNSIKYSNVIHVSATISSALIPASSLTSSLNSYYAPKYGLIESSTKINLDYTGLVENVNISVKLVNSSLL
jgi:hypothetical protein